ncbi:MAG: hypothetical protein ACRCV0_04895 [Brevinema sp.]
MSDHEIASNEVAFDSRKEGDCIVEIKTVEGEVYKFQTDISWTGVDTSFKTKVINAMIELYCDYKKNICTLWSI